MIAKSFKNIPKPHKWMISSVAAFLCLLFLFPSDPVSAYKNTASTLEIGKRYDLAVNFDSLPINEFSGLDELHEVRSFTVKKGDNLAIIFKRAGFTPQDTYHVSKAGDDAKKLLKMKPGQTLDLEIDKSGKLVSLKYPYSTTDTLIIEHDVNNDFVSKVQSKKVDTRLNYAQGEIVSSFWNAGREASLSDNQIMSLAGIFGWDIDFALGIRAGDQFYVTFEEHYIDGEFIENGNIVAAQFVNQGESYTAVRYTDGNYYTAEGRSMRKSFLRAPVNFRYISSNFNPKRFHPIQKRVRPHNGTDYRASTGTPVVASGDGKVTHSAYNKYNGNYVFIQHPNGIVTKYLHFSKRKVKKGQRVKQGQVIGLVGSTGMSQAPHLHYEFLVAGVHRNPRTVSLPKAEPIAAKEKSKFMTLANQVMTQLDNNKRIMLSMNY
ncbi:MAG: peptidoglycan DD-metalloendopeptidase family protein [Paraglaciecola sp.]|uniref:peptidoglycan DD-metalloendopeptidase family protein n=1 Tax=Paraglaciecola sp. TaxID=1920173 RepID=UPI003265A0FD